MDTVDRWTKWTTRKQETLFWDTDEVAQWARTIQAKQRSSTFPQIAADGALLDRQVAAQAKAFETEGAFSERLYRSRTSRRSS